MSDQPIEAGTELARYDAAVRALAEAEAVDEVLEIRNEAAAIAAYARQAKDRQLEVKAMHIRFRAVRRLGELIKAQRETIGLNRGRAGMGRPALGGADTEQPKSDERPTLKEAGIDRKLSSQAQRMAEVPLARFEELLKRHQAEALGGAAKVSADLLRVDSEDEGRRHRRNLAAELSAQTAALPTGRQYPAWYVDLPWKRKGGITDRSYENHYPTMDWPEILEFLKGAQDLLLPDAWGFFWIPRAHLLAAVDLELEAPHAETGEIVPVRARLPLAWAIMLAAGFDSYSTCYVWTKTDEEHPDESGSGIIAYDQDELLLLFKRGRGLPKPETAKKYGSNHRERARLLGHSRKPEHYRQMIVDMVGTDLNGEPLPVMEFFARVDADNPLPRNWSAWGNQAQGSDGGGEAAATAERPAGTGDRLAEPLGAVTPAADQPSQQPRPEADERERKDAGIAPGPSEAIAEADPATSASAAAAPAEGGAAATLFPELPAPAPREISELEALKAFSDFCYPDRAAICAQLGAEYQAKGFAIEQGGTGQWILLEAGRARLAELQEASAPAPADNLDIPKFLRRPQTARPQLEMDLARIDRAPAEVVDDKLQTRIPLTEDELELQAALRLVAIGKGAGVHWSVKRDLIGAGFLHVTVEREIVTEEGEAFLAQLVAPAEGAAA